MKPLTDEELAEIRKDRLALWPITVHRLMATLDHLRAERDQARAELARMRPPTPAPLMLLPEPACQHNVEWTKCEKCRTEIAKRLDARLVKR